MPSISVIMPAYRVENYIERAVRSLTEQTFEDFELIIVDDGSPDSTGALCDRLAQQDSRLRVIHQENAGAPAARNLAMTLATGRYFFFMDADDWAERNMLAELFQTAEQHQLQAVVAGFYIDTYYDDEHFTRQTLAQPSEIFTSQAAFRAAAYRLFDTNLLYPPWNKLFRADYLKAHGIEFPLTFWDDFPFNLAVFADIERVGVIQTPYYHFIRARAESETARYRADMYEKREEEHRWMLDLYRHWHIDDSASREMICRRYAERVIGCIENVANPACPDSYAQKCAAVRAMLKNPHLTQALSTARPHSLMMKILFISLKTRCAPLVLFEGQFISLVKRRCTRLFANLKARR